MITANLTRTLPQPPLRGAPKQGTPNPIGMLTRIYRQAGLPIEAARRCALADLQCTFPQFLESGV